MSSKKLKTDLFSREERYFWKNIEVNIDSYCDRWDEIYKEKFIKGLKLFSYKTLTSLFEHFNYSYDKDAKLTTVLKSNTKLSILVLCLHDFSLKHPKGIAELYNITWAKSNPDKSKVIDKVFELYKKERLEGLFLYLLKQKLGKGFIYKLSENISDEDYENIIKFIKPLTYYLKRIDKQKKEYKYRFSYKGTKLWYFLILKETADKVAVAIPNNISTVSGVYRLISLDPKTKELMINVQSKDESIKIRNYFSRKLENRISYKRNEFTYDPVRFFNLVLDENESKDIKIVDASFKDSNWAKQIRVTDEQYKNDIIPVLADFKRRGTLKLNDFSEFKNFTFTSYGLTIKVNVYETIWGTHRLTIVDKNITRNDLEKFSKSFEDKFGVILNQWLKPNNSKQDKQRLLSKILDKKTILVNQISQDVEELLLELIENKILQKLQKEAKRVCESCRNKTWDKSNACPKCGNDLYIEGRYFDVKINKKGAHRFVYNLLKRSGLNVSDINIQIAKQKHSIIEILDDNHDNLSVYVSSDTPPVKLLTHFEESGNPLLVILCRYKNALNKQLKERNFSCKGLVELYIKSAETENLNNDFQNILKYQKDKWNERILRKGYESYTNILDKYDEYDHNDFEKDIYNLLHEIFKLGDKLGDSFIGIKAPDGIVSIREYKTPSKYCMAWDCKFSNHTDGYQLNEKPEKHRHYINKLKGNDKIKFYGNLKTYAIISQNMDFSKYETFYKKVKFRFRWKGNILFIPEDVIVRLYSFYRENNKFIEQDPNSFYSSIFRLFSKIHKKDLKPFPLITEQRLELFFKEMETKYRGKSLKFKFSRKEF